MGERVVTFQNIHNFRDLGGLVGLDGAAVRTGRVFRSDDLSRVTGEDQATFSALGVRTVIDLRRPVEVENIGRIPAFDGFTYRHIHLDYPSWPATEFATTEERAAYVTERYLEMAETATVGMRDALRIIADADQAPVVFHCIAGKDRTGVVAAVTLSLLGVADADIADDYHQSEHAEAANWAWYRSRDSNLPVKRWQEITVSPPQGMLDFLAELRRRHGSVEAYTEKIGLTAAEIGALRAHLLG
jgi:protein tyrosine/serine phosphatase